MGNGLKPKVAGVEYLERLLGESVERHSQEIESAGSLTPLSVWQGDSSRRRRNGIVIVP